MKKQSNLNETDISQRKHTKIVVWLLRKPMKRKRKENLEKK